MQKAKTELRTAEVPNLWRMHNSKWCTMPRDKKRKTMSSRKKLQDDPRKN